MLSVLSKKTVIGNFLAGIWNESIGSHADNAITLLKTQCMG